MIRSLLLIALLSIPLIAFADQQSHWAAAYELLDAAQAQKIVEIMKVQVGQSMRRLVTESQLNAEQQAVVDNYVLKAVEEVGHTMDWGRLKEEFATLYVSVYTEPELRELTTFYKSPLGQKMLGKMPQLLQQSMQLAQRHKQDSMPRFQQLSEQMAAELKRLRK